MRVAIVFGGQSSEHEISCLGAASVAGAITDLEIIGIGISKTGKWHKYQASQIIQLKQEGTNLPQVDDTLPEVAMIRNGSKIQVITLDKGIVTAERLDIDVLFPVLHGPLGEDGTIQGFCEILGLPYVGANVSASALGMDKVLMKMAFQEAGLKVGPFIWFMAEDYYRNPAAIAEQVGSLEFPLYVKPARGGSSIGITRVQNLEELAEAVAEAAKWDPKIIVEQGFSEVREIEFGVLEEFGAEPLVSVPGEIAVNINNGFYDFDTKYLDETGVQLIVDTEVPQPLLTEAKEIAAKAFQAIGASGLSRVDLFLVDEKIWINEINTMPGFTSHSMYPLLLAASGVPYPEVIRRLIKLALQHGTGLR